MNGANPPPGKFPGGGLFQIGEALVQQKLILTK
jgi:hypothetical protein